MNPGDAILSFEKRSGKSKTVTVLAIFMFGGLAGCSVGNLFNDADDKQAARQEPIDDGPYVYWKDSTNAVVFYVCDGELLTAKFQAADTLRFDGMCSDSANIYKIPVADPSIEADRYGDISKIFAVSDIHGEYDYLVDILKSGGVIDDRKRWIFGDGHLVIDGDVFDRGGKVTECLWLIYRLEQEALEAGGRVHYLLGNHELMGLIGDLRYVSEKYTDGIVKKSRLSYDRLFGGQTVLGRWLRTRNTVAAINGILFVHGGISSELIRRYGNISEVNKAVREDLPRAPYWKVLNDEEMFVYNDLGPFWYRGYFMELGYPQATRRQVEDILKFYNAEAVVVGHTESDSLMSHYGGLVYSIDVPAEEMRSLQALFWQDGIFYRVRGDGEKVIMR